jgi:hypothetical protein
MRESLLKVAIEKGSDSVQPDYLATYMLRFRFVRTKRKVNDEFKEDVITPSVTSKNQYFIDPSDSLSQQYLNEYNNNLLAGANQLRQDELDRGVTETGEGEFYQTAEMPASKASKETLELVKNAARQMGISIQDLADYAKSVGLDTKSINGVADLTKGVIAVAQGMEDAALTEELVHIATAIMEQTNPQLVTSMISKIDRFKIYKTTLDKYKNERLRNKNIIALLLNFYINFPMRLEIMDLEFVSSEKEAKTKPAAIFIKNKKSIWLYFNSKKKGHSDINFDLNDPVLNSFNNQNIKFFLLCL